MNRYKTMELIVRQEQASDIRDVSELLEMCFKSKNAETLVSVLKKRKKFIPGLSLVVTLNRVIAGYVLLNPLEVRSGNLFSQTLWIEPMCVHPNFQKMGLGRMLMESAFEKALDFGYDSLVAIGDCKFYSKFGFKNAEERQLTSSYYIPPSAFFSIVFKQSALPEKARILFPPEIFE